MKKQAFNLEGIDEMLAIYNKVKDNAPTDIEKCPLCGRCRLIVQIIDGEKNYALNSLSRRDNETYICSSCGTAEAMQDFLLASSQMKGGQNA